MSEKNNEAINNGQSTNNDNTGHTRHRAKTNKANLKKKQLTTQKTNKMTNTEPSRSKMYVMYITFFIYRQLT